MSFSAPVTRVNLRLSLCIPKMSEECTLTHCHVVRSSKGHGKTTVVICFSILNNALQVYVGELEGKLSLS